jgi:hypothetical protein
MLRELMVNFLARLNAGSFGKSGYWSLVIANQTVTDNSYQVRTKAVKILSIKEGRSVKKV